MRLLLIFSALILNSPFYAQENCQYNLYPGVDFNAGGELAKILLEQADGKLIGTGTSYFGGANFFQASLFRLDNDGSLDQTFGENGRVSNTWESRNSINCATITTDQQILIGGYQAPGNGASTFRGYIGRLENDGTIDSTFAEAGSFEFNEIDGQRSIMVGVHELPDGKIMATMSTNQSNGVTTFRLLADGTLDTSYASMGFQQHTILDMMYQVDYNEAHFTPDSNIYMITKYLQGSETYPMVIKIGPDGGLDSTFAENGVWRSTIPTPFNYNDTNGAIDGNGDIYLGFTNNSAPSRFIMTKINGATGELDNTFGSEGTVQSTDSGAFNAPWDVVIDPVQEIIYSIGMGGYTGGRHPTVWTIDMNGNEVADCGLTATHTYTDLGVQGLYSGLIDQSGHLKLLGITSQMDTTTQDIGQGINMFIAGRSIPSSLSELNKRELSIYPNPTSEQLYIDGLQDYQMDYQIFGIDGALIKSGVTDGQIQLSELTRGYYFLKVSSDDGSSYVGKILKE